MLTLSKCSFPHLAPKKAEETKTQVDIHSVRCFPRKRKTLLGRIKYLYRRGNTTDTWLATAKKKTKTPTFEILFFSKKKPFYCGSWVSVHVWKGVRCALGGTCLCMYIQAGGGLIRRGCCDVQFSHSPHALRYIVASKARCFVGESVKKMCTRIYAHEIVKEERGIKTTCLLLMVHY